jgi:hypothetical protein
MTTQDANRMESKESNKAVMQFVDEVVLFAHNGNRNIKESIDFIHGAKYAYLLMQEREKQKKATE